MLERRNAPLLSRRKFIMRMTRSVGMAFALVTVGLGVGVLGYHLTMNLPWVDSLLNASMILTGMGPVDPMKTISAKLFASFYALFSGVAFLTMAAIILTPLIHRFLHRFHLEPDEDGEGSGEKAASPRRPAKGTRP